MERDSSKKGHQHHRGPGGTSLASNAEHLEDNVSFQCYFTQIPNSLHISLGLQHYFTFVYGGEGLILSHPEGPAYFKLNMLVRKHSLQGIFSHWLQPPPATCPSLRPHPTFACLLQKVKAIEAAEHPACGLFLDIPCSHLLLYSEPIGRLINGDYDTLGRKKKPSELIL